MKVISTLTHLFVKPAVIEEGREVEPQQRFTLKVSPNPVQVPAWVADSDEMEILIDCGKVIPANNFVSKAGKPNEDQLALLTDDDVIAESTRRGITAASDIKDADDKALVDEVRRRGLEELASKALTNDDVLAEVKRRDITLQPKPLTDDELLAEMGKRQLSAPLTETQKAQVLEEAPLETLLTVYTRREDEQKKQK